jgi:hypothetical protein
MKKHILKFISMLLLCITLNASAIVLHPGPGDPNLVTWTDHPPSEVIGRWSDNASCIAIAPNYVISTTHQGISLSKPIEIDGVTYKIQQIWRHPDNPNPIIVKGITYDVEDVTYDKIDICVAKLQSANLQHHTDLYNPTETDPNEIGEITIAGFGLARGTDLANQTGYNWQSGTVSNQNVRWCTNKIDIMGSIIAGPNYGFDALIADFNGPTDPNNTTYEGTVAEFDSGGGWFKKNEATNQWELVGLTFGVQHAEDKIAIFNPAQQMYAVRISPYADWIQNILDADCESTLQNDYNGDCVINAADLAIFAENWLNQNCTTANNNCNQADTQPDGKVDLQDFASLSNTWLPTD